MIRTIFIDLDDTLWDTRANNRDAMSELFVARGWENKLGNFEDWYEIYSAHNDHLWDEYRKGHITKSVLILERLRQPLQGGLGTLSEEQLLDINKEFLDLVAHKKKLVKGAISLLVELKKLYKLVVLSNGFREVQMGKMMSSGIDGYFDYVVLSEDAGANKPNKAIFDYAFSLSQSRPSETIMIGDSFDADIQGAINAGIPSIWYNPNGIKRAYKSEFLRPVYEVKSLEEICDLLRTLRVFFP